MSCLCAAFRRRMLGYSSDGELIGEGDKTSADYCDSKSCLSNRRGSTGSLSFLASHRCRLLDRRSYLWPSGRCCASLSFAQEDPHHLLPSFLPASVRIFDCLTMVNGLFNIDSLRLNWLQPRLVPFLIGKPAHAGVSDTCIPIYASFSPLICHQMSDSDIGVIDCLGGRLAGYRVAAVLLYGVSVVHLPSLSNSPLSLSLCVPVPPWRSVDTTIVEVHSVCVCTCASWKQGPVIPWQKLQSESLNVTNTAKEIERRQSFTQGIKQSPVLHLVLSAVGTARRWQLWLTQQHHIGAHS